MKKIFLALLVFFFCAQLWSQQAELYVKSGDRGLYLEHKVAPKENFYSLGRLYNAHPKAIAAYNKLDFSKGLAIGQPIRIPLTDTNFSQKVNKGAPVYYQVGANEGLMKVSSLHKNVTLESLRNWNGLPDNNVKAGDKLVVGFLTSGGMPSVAIADKPKPQQAAIKKEEAPLFEIKQETATAPRQDEMKKDEPVKTDPTPVKKEEPKDVKKEEVVKPEPVAVKQEVRVPLSENGYFKNHFDQQVKQSPVKKEETVTSGIFKTTSGWLDSKYYMLIDGVVPGTIVRVSNPSNNKIIYAKVLGEMSGIRQNEGLNIRVSSAAASALQITEQDKFIVSIRY